MFINFSKTSNVKEMMEKNKYRKSSINLLPPTPWRGLFVSSMFEKMLI